MHSIGLNSLEEELIVGLLHKLHNPVPVDSNAQRQWDQTPAISPPVAGSPVDKSYKQRRTLQEAVDNNSASKLPAGIDSGLAINPWKENPDYQEKELSAAQSILLLANHSLPSPVSQLLPTSHPATRTHADSEADFNREISQSESPSTGASRQEAAHMQTKASVEGSQKAPVVLPSFDNLIRTDTQTPHQPLPNLPSYRNLVESRTRIPSDKRRRSSTMKRRAAPEYPIDLNWRKNKYHQSPLVLNPAFKGIDPYPSTPVSLTSNYISPEYSSIASNKNQVKRELNRVTSLYRTDHFYSSVATRNTPYSRSDRGLGNRDFCL